MNPTNNSPDQRYTESSYGPGLVTPPVTPTATYPTSPVSPPIVSPPIIQQPPVDHSTFRYEGSVYDSSLETAPTGLTPVVSMPQTVSAISMTELPPLDTHSDGFSPFRYNRTALLATVSAVTIVALIGLATLLFGNHFFKSGTTAQSSSTPSSQYATSNLPLSNLAVTGQLEVSPAERLTINGQLVVNDTVVLAPGVVPATPVTGQFYYNKTTNQPYYYDGTTFVSLEPSVVTPTAPTPTTAANVCIQSATNCGFALAGSGVTTVNGLAGAVTNVCIQNSTNCGFAVAGSGVTTVNGLASSLTIANATGTGTIITIQDASTTQKGIAQFTAADFTATAGVIDTVQGITTTSDVQFASLGLGTTSTTGNLTLGTTGSLIANNLTHTATGNNITINAGADNISFTNGSGSNTFFLPTSGGIGQVICTTAITCAAGGGQAVILEPVGIQSSNSNLDALAINKASGSGNLLKLQTGGVDALVITSSGNTTISNTTTITSLQTNSLTPTAALTIGATAQSYSLQGNASSTISATNAGSTTAIGFVTPTANVNYQFATAAAGTYGVCTTAVVCAGYTPSSGSSNYLQLQATTPGTAQTGNSNITGVSIAGTFAGSGANLTSLNGSNISSGTVADARLSANVALLNGTQTFTSANTFSSALTSGITGTNTGSILFKGSTGASGTLTLIGQSNPTNNTLTLPNETGAVCTTGSVCSGYAPSTGSGNYAPISGSSNYIQLQATTPGTAQTGNSNITGASIAGSFSGAGTNLTNLNGSNINSGTVADARLSTNVTLQGNTFNGISQLVQTTAGGILPILNGSNLTSLNGTNIASGTVADARLTTNVTLQGNTFNGVSQLVQTTGAGTLPTISGTNLTSLNGSNISSGTVADARLTANVALLNGTQTFTSANTFSSALALGTTGTNTGSAQFKGSTVASGTITLIGQANPTNNTLTLPNETGTVCTTGSVCTGYAPSTGSGSYAPITGGTGYLQLQATTPGSAQTGNSNITGVSIAGTFSGSGASLTSLNGSNISSGTVADARLSTAVTLQGNTFNGVSQLVQTTAGGILPALSGANLTSLNASNITSGTVADARLSANVALLNGTGPQTFTGNNKFTGTLLSENASNSTAAFQVQTAGATSVLNVDTTNQRVSVGSIGTATAQLYVAGMLPSTTNTLVTGSNNAQFFTVQGRYAYIANNSTSNFMIIDTTRPANMAVISTTTPTGMSSPYAVAVSGKYAYVTNNADTTNAYGLEILDISNPSAPVLVGHIGTNVANTGGARQLVVQGRYVFLVNAVTNTIQSFDVANPAAPVALTTQSTGTTPISITIQGRYAYVTNQGASSFTAFDISNPGSIPAGTAWTTNTSTPIPVAVSGRYAYVMSSTSSSSFQVFDISNPTTPAAAIGSTTGGATPISLTVQGRYAYVAYNGGNFQAFDISNPTAPSSIGTYATGLSAVAGLTVSGRYAYITASTGISSLDLGGTYSQQLEAGGIETGTLQVNGNANFGNNVSIANSLQVGQSLQVSGNVGSSGSVLFQNATNSTTALRVQNAAGTAVLDVDTTNGYVGIGTTTPGASLDVIGVAAAVPTISFGNGTTVAASTTSTIGSIVGKSTTSNFSINLQDGCRTSFNWNASGGSGNYLVSSEPASRLCLHIDGTTGGQLAFSGAAAGTAGSAITWTTAMNINTGDFAWISPRGTSSDFYVNNSGNVGIGTATPLAKLNVQANATFVDGRSGQVAITGATDPNMALGLGYDTTGNYGWIQAAQNFTGFKNLALNPGGGNVGIGTTAPAAKLEVYGIAASGNGTVQTLLVNSPGDAAITINSVGTTQYAYQTFAQGGVGKFEMGVVPTTSDLYINPNVQSGSGGAALYIKKSNGNVGIGTTAPSTILTVVDAGNGNQFSGTASVIANNLSQGVGIGYEGISKIGSNVSSDLYLNAKGTGNVILQTNATGNVGIGTAGPNYKLTIADSSAVSNAGLWIDNNYGGVNDLVESDIVLGGRAQARAWGRISGQQTLPGSYAEGQLNFYTYSGNVAHTQPDMVIKNTGYVGIGTTAPPYTLTVAPGALGSGLGVGWNKSSGSGETDFYNYGQGGGGGFQFWNYANPGSTYPTTGSVNLLTITNAGNVISNSFASTVATGTAPFTVASTTKVVNLNADLLDGLDSTAFGDATAANQTTILNRIGTSADAAGTTTLFARFAQLFSYLGTPSDSASSSGSLFAQVRDVRANVGQTKHMQTFTSSGSWGTPAGVTSADVIVVGGGGSTGLGGGTLYSGAGGGGVTKGIVSVSGTMTVTVGGAGGTSSFGTLTATGGGSANGSGTPGVGGSGSGGFTVPGGNGGNSNASNAYAGGGAAGGGNGGSSTSGAVGGAGDYGNGGNGAAFGTGYGSGAGGAIGAGQPGVVIVVWYQ